MKHTVTRRGFTNHTSYEWAPEPGLVFVLDINADGATLSRYANGQRTASSVPADDTYVAAVIEAADLATRAHKAANALMLPTVQTMRA